MIDQDKSPTQDTEHHLRDRELLELAAKAAGAKAVRWVEDECPFLGGWNFEVDFGDGCYFEWSPLVDGGDALRLAVVARLSIMIEDGVVWCQHPSIADVIVRTDELGASLERATCRAITLAAAVIGRAMP